MANLQTRVDALETDMTGLKSKISRALELESRVTRLEAEIQEANNMIAVIAGTPVSPAQGAQGAPSSLPAILLEDFDTLRLNYGDVSDLWSIYLGEDPNQTGGWQSGTKDFKISLTGTTGEDPYFQFFPSGSAGYNTVNGHARGYLKSGTWSDYYNNLTFWVKTSSTISPLSVGNTGQVQFGTYSRPDDGDSGNQGQHFYHFLNTKWTANKHTKVWINKHPQHQVGQNSNQEWGDNPTLVDPTNIQSGSTFDYFLGLTRFYFDGIGGFMGNGDYYFDDFYFEYDPDNTDEYVSSVTIGHDGTDFHLGWSSRKYTDLTYNVYYHTSNIRTAGLGAATLIGTATSPNSAYADCYKATSGGVAFPAGGMYFAIEPPGDIGFSHFYLENRD